MRVHVKNFQSLTDASIDVEGLTVLVGPSDLGKSALVRAVSGALFNLPGDFFVRRGSSFAQVTLEGVPTADPGKTLNVRWSKGASKNEFEVDGELFKKVGTDTPAPLVAAGYREVSDEAVRPQVADQFDRLFLLDRPGSVVASVLTALSRVLVVSSADRLCAKDTKDTKKLESVRRGDLARVETDVAATGEIEGFSQRVERLHSQAEAHKAEAARVALVRRTVGERAAAVRALAVHVLPAAVEVSERVVSAGSRVAEIGELVRRRRGVLPLTQPLPVEFSAVATPELAERVREGRELARRRLAALTVVADALPAEVLILEEALTRQALDLAEARRCATVRARAVQLLSLQCPPETVDPAKIDAETARLHLQIREVQSLVPHRAQAVLALRAAESGAQALAVESEAATAAFARALAEAKVCALCGQTLPHSREAGL